jgi:excisionase family DNA binding protein
MPIRNLSTHPAHYLTVAELADYWAVSRQQIYKRIESGALGAIRLGSRIYRVPAHVALEYERRASVPGVAKGIGAERDTPEAKPLSVNHKLPDKIGPQRVRKVFG